jgi:hypothetical protein
MKIEKIFNFFIFILKKKWQRQKNIFTNSKVKNQQKKRLKEFNKIC